MLSQFECCMDTKVNGANPVMGLDVHPNVNNAGDKLLDQNVSRDLVSSCKSVFLIMRIVCST